VNYVKIPHEFIECIMRMRGSSVSILLCIARFTYGYHRESHPISYSLFEKMTGIAVNKISSIISELTIEGIIAKKTINGKPTEYSINESYFTPTPDLGLTPTPDLGLTPTPDLGLTPTPDLGLTPTPDLGLTPTPDLGLHKRKRKENFKENNKERLNQKKTVTGSGFSLSFSFSQIEEIEKKYPGKSDEIFRNVQYYFDNDTKSKYRWRCSVTNVLSKLEMFCSKDEVQRKLISEGFVEKPTDDEIDWSQWGGPKK
jgi:hypothetical protein